MLGQDTIKLSFTDTLNAVADSFPATVFDLSNIAGGGVQVEESMEMIQRTQTMPPTWFFIYLFVLLGFFAWIRLYYGNILTQTIQASTNFQMATRMFKDNSLLQIQLDNILYAFYFLNIAFLLYLVEERFQIYPYGLQGGPLYFFNLAFLVGIFFGRIVFVILTGFLFNRLNIFREYLYNTFIFNKLMGMTILPVLLFVVYTTEVLKEVFFWLAIAIATLVVFMRLIRGLVFSFKKDVSIFYMFLYLCALEIAPLVLLYRWLEGVL